MLTPAAGTPWVTDVTDRLLDLAQADIADHGHLWPGLWASRDGALVLVDWFRPFPAGAHADPVIEAAALAVPSGANQLAVVLGGRAWSLDDPIPPVTVGADLRQEVVLVTAADGAVSPPQVHTAVQPWERTATGPRFDAPVRMGAGEGWLPGALRVMVGGDGAVPDDPPPDVLRRQAHRLDALGHRLWIAEATAERLGEPVTGS